MSSPAHAGRAHALLGASKADQWLNCPPSARIQEKVPDKRSEYAEEGTAAHEYSELLLERKLTVCDSKKRKRLDAAIEKFKQNNSFYGTEMEGAVANYVDVVGEKYMEAVDRSRDAVLLLEDRLDFTEWVPEGFGTGDVVLISDGVLEVIDLKYGKGVPVSAVNNPQLRLYGLGAYSNYSFLYNIEEIRMTIVQPRLDSVSTDSLPIGELLDWAEEVVKPAATLAFDGKGDYEAGEHCRWCKVKGNCRARAEANMEALAYEFKDPALLTLDEVGSILFVADQLSSWAKDVKDFAHDQAVNGAKIPQWKLVEGRSNRIITDKVAARSAFEEAEIESGKYLKTDLHTITELEKRVGKKEFAEILGNLVLKPPGKPTLAPETDRRPEINSVENDFADEDFNV